MGCLEPFNHSRTTLEFGGFLDWNVSLILHCVIMTRFLSDLRQDKAIHNFTRNVSVLMNMICSLINIVPTLGVWIMDCIAWPPSWFVCFSKEHPQIWSLLYFGAILWSVATSLNRGKLESKLKAHVKRGSWTELKSIFPGNRDRIGGFDFNMSSIYSSGPFQLVFLDPMHNLIDRITGITHLCRQRHGLIDPRALSIASYQLHCPPSNCFDFWMRHTKVERVKCQNAKWHLQACIQRDGHQLHISIR